MRFSFQVLNVFYLLHRDGADQMYQAGCSVDIHFMKKTYYVGNFM